MNAKPFKPFSKKEKSDRRVREKGGEVKENPERKATLKRREG